jgi:hypothetical protein
MVFNATFNNISVISWWSVLLVEDNRVSVVVVLLVNFNCSYMARNSLTYIPVFSVKCFFQPIYTD